MGMKVAVIHTLREMMASYFFWPAAALMAIGLWMAVWAVTLYQVDWVGQGVWAVLFTVVASGMMVFAFNETRPQGEQTYS
jgi:hypothetical protein